MAGIDFSIEVRERDDGYELSVDSKAGNATEPAERPFDELVLKNRLLTLENALLRSSGVRRVVPTDDEQEVQRFGEELYRWLFRGKFASLIDSSRNQARESRTPLRIRLQIDSPALAKVPWEFLYDPGRRDYLALSTNTPVVRFVEVPQPNEPLKVSGPLRMLVMVASPSDLPPLDAKREHLRLTEATKALVDEGLLEIEWLPGGTRAELDEALDHGPWHIFHFVGHGGFDRQADEGIVALVDDKGATAKLHATDLARLLGDHRPLRLAVLNACEGAKESDHDLFSSTAAAIVRRETPAVIAMQYEITDPAAIEFCRLFYGAVARGNPVDVAVSSARRAMAASKTLEWGTPVLIMQSPDGRIFDVRRSRRQRAAGTTADGAAPAEVTAAVATDAKAPTTQVPAVPGSEPPTPIGTAASTTPQTPRRTPLAALPGVTARAVAASLVLLVAGVLLGVLASVAVQPGQSTPIPTVGPDPAEVALLAHIPASLGCERTKDDPEAGEMPGVTTGLLVGQRCDRIGGVRAGINSNMYWLYDGAESAEAAYLDTVANTAANGMACPADPSASGQASRLHVTCVQGARRAAILWFDPANAIYGRLNGPNGSQVRDLYPWWRQHGVLADAPDLTRRTQCDAVEWAAAHGASLGVAEGPGDELGGTLTQTPIGQNRLDRTGAVAVTVALDRPVPLVKVTGYDDVVARRLVEALGVANVRTVYTGMRQAGVPTAPGVVLGTVPTVESAVDEQSCVALQMSGTGRAVPVAPPQAASPAALPSTPAPAASPAPVPSTPPTIASPTPVPSAAPSPAGT